MIRRDFVRLVPLALAVAGCSSSSPAGADRDPTTAPPPPPPVPPPGIGANMRIVDNAFVDPTGRRNAAAAVTIDSGEAVRWTSSAYAEHTVTSTSVPQGAGTVQSGNISPGGVFDHTFTTPGTYVYRCDLHPGEMFDATVIVQ